MAIDYDALPALHKAVLARDFNLVKQLLDAGANVNEVAQDDTPLLIAVENRDYTMIELLLSHHCNVDKQNAYGMTPLLLAVELGSYEIVKLLIAAGSDVNIADLAGYTPLYKALDLRHYELFKVLFHAGADVNVIYDNVAILHLAAYKGNEEIVSMLLDAGCDKGATDSFGVTTLHYAALNMNPKVIAKFLEAGSCSQDAVKLEDITGANVLDYAITDSNIEAVKVLLDAGCDINALRDVTTLRRGEPDTYYRKGKTSLHFAAENNSPELIRLLIEAGADPKALDKYGLQPIDYANYATLSTLLSFEDESERLSHLNNIFEIALTYGGGNEKTIEYLIELSVLNGGLPNLFFEKALGHAINVGKPNIVKMLLDVGCDFEALVDYGGGFGEGTSLMHALEVSNFNVIQNINVIKMLIKAGANVSIIHKILSSWDFYPDVFHAPLHYALYLQSSKEAVQLLLNSGCDVFQTYKLKAELLDWAKTNTQTDLVKILTESEGDVLRIEFIDPLNEIVSNWFLSRKINYKCKINLSNDGTKHNEIYLEGNTPIEEGIKEPSVGWGENNREAQASNSRLVIKLLEAAMYAKNIINKIENPSILAPHFPYITNPDFPYKDGYHPSSLEELEAIKDWLYWELLRTSVKEKIKEAENNPTELMYILFKHSALDNDSILRELEFIREVNDSNDRAENEEAFVPYILGKIPLNAVQKADEIELLLSQVAARHEEIVGFEEEIEANDLNPNLLEYISGHELAALWGKVDLRNDMPMKLARFILENENIPEELKYLFPEVSYAKREEAINMWNMQWRGQAFETGTEGTAEVEHEVCCAGAGAGAEGYNESLA